MTSALTDAPTITGYHVLPIGELFESPKNPRKHFDPAKLEELKASIGEHGVLTPLLARPSHGGFFVAPPESGSTRWQIINPKGVGLSTYDTEEEARKELWKYMSTGITYELAAGHRRFRASKLAGLTELPVIVREMSDTQLVEILTIENLQRDDVHELEEAQGFADLIRVAGYDVEKIAARISMSVKYVYDRLKLLNLIPELQTLFFDRKIAASHAIILARLTSADQKRAASYPNGGLWSRDDKWQTDLAGDQHEVKGFGAVQPQSVRQLQHWVDTHVRIDPERDADAQLFPELAAVAAPALEKEEKVVAITYNTFVHPDAKVDGERTYGPSSWERADGREKSKPCDRSVIGVIVVGEGRGDSFRVCVDKQKCKTHWGAEIARREKRATSSTSSSSSSAPAKPAGKSAHEIEREKREAREAAWVKLLPTMIPAVAAHVKKAPAGGRSLLAQLILDDVGNESKKAAAIIGRGKSAEDLVRYIAFQILFDRANRTYNAFESFPKLAKEIGLDVAKIMKAAEPAPLTKTPVFAKTPTPAKKGKAKKLGRVAEFMKPMQPSEQLAAIIGKGPMPKTEVTKKFWGYIKRNNLQDKKERRMIIADDKMKLVFGGKARVSMFEMTKLVNKHLKPTTA